MDDGHSCQFPRPSRTAISLSRCRPATSHRRSSSSLARYREQRVIATPGRPAESEKSLLRYSLLRGKFTVSYASIVGSSSCLNHRLRAPGHRKKPWPKPQTFVIIGSSIVGSVSPIIWRRPAARAVLVIEREAHQGKASTSKSMGGVRAQFSTPVNIQMSRYSIDFFSRFDEVVGQPADYRAHGYLFCATSESHLAYLKANRERQIALGVSNVEWVSPEEIQAIVPQLRTDDILGGTFCPTDGFVDPHSVMMGFMLNARERGARLWLDTEVTGIEVENDQDRGVETSRGQVATRRRQRCRRVGG